jgi:hypothetical protein
VSSPTDKTQSSRIKIVIISSIIFFTIVGVFLYYREFGVLVDDQKLIEAIKSNPEVNYPFIELGGIRPQTDYQNPLIYPDYSHLPSYWVRSFRAWEYPRDSVKPSENNKIIGLIDDRLRITIIARMRGDLAFE